MAERPMEHFTVDGVNIFEVTDAKARQDVSDLKDDLYNTLVTDTASGAIASFSDGADGVPVKSLSVAIEPVQAGTGDPSPTNIRPISGHTQAKVTRTGKNVLNPVAKLAGFWAPTVGTHINPLTTNYASFSNDTITVDAPEWNGNGFVSNPLVEGKKYKITGTINADSPRCSFVVTDADMNVTRAINNLLESGSINFSATIASGEKYIAVSLINSNNNRGVTFANPCVSEDDTYEPYNGQTYTIDLNGTRYGGTLDVTTGVLTVDSAVVDMGTLNWSGFASSYGFTLLYAPISGLVAEQASEGVCSTYKMLVGNYSWNNLGDKQCILYVGAGEARIGVRDSSYDNPITFASAVSGQTVVYKLAEPFTVQLTANDIKTLLGTNNIWSDAGTVDVAYRADTKLYIEKLTAPTEDDMVADHAISANSFFMVGNTLYRATTAIASGATITVGTNATKMSLSEALNALS